MRRVIVLFFSAAVIFAWIPVNASVISSGSFSFQYGGATVISIEPDPGVSPPWGRATISNFFNFPPTIIEEAESIFVRPVEDYNGSFGGSNYSVQPDFDAPGIEWNLEAESATPGGRRNTNYGFAPLVTLDGEVETLDFTINYGVEAQGDSFFDYTVAQVQVLISYGTTIVLDQFATPAVEFRGFDTSVVEEDGSRTFNVMKPPNAPDTDNWIIQMRMFATASDFLPEDSPPPTVPEPSTLLLMGLGLAGLGFARRSRLNT